jgi:type III secretion system FlhB-like substrate exporter
VLSPAELAQRQRARQTLPSLKQQYQEYLLNRIESYKESLSWNERMALPDEARRELDSGEQGQFFLTEILLTEMVDQLIMKRLRLPSYKKWRTQYADLRKAQREPVHWGVDPECALVRLLPRLESGDKVLLVGSGVQAEAFLLAAHDCEVTFLAEDLGLVDQIDSRASAEALSERLYTCVAVLGNWLPAFDHELDLVVIDAGTLSTMEHANRQTLLIGLSNLTRPGGVHVLLPAGSSSAPEGYLSHYPDWDREPAPPRRKASRSRGVILTRPVVPS